MLTLPLEGVDVSADTDISVLDSILGPSRKELAPELSEDEFFELFSAHKILRDFQLDPDEIASGQIGTKDSNKNGSDGGIDGFYLFANGKLVREVADAEGAKKNLTKNVSVDLVLIQATTHNGFTLDRITRLKDTCDDIFSLNLEPKDFSEQYNPLLLDAIDRFRTLYRILASRYPTYSLSMFYVTKGDIRTVSDTLRGTANDIGKTVHNALPRFENPQFHFIGARQLIDLASKPPKLDFSLQCSGVVSSKRQGGYAGFVSLAEFLNFIITEDGQLRTTLFESNVRDYQGEIAVNEAIGNTLLNKGTEDFWWLNNGITIVAEKTIGETRQIQLTDPQIVNGLQTSQKIFDYYTDRPNDAKNDSRELLVRVIQAPNVESHDAIIRATNSQTSIPAPFLWATGQIHRDIESYFRSNDLYYDRRKNSWRREAIPFDKVVGITELAQSVASVIRQEPDHARARPGRFFSTKARHKAIFADVYGLDLYVVCSHLKKKAASFLKRVEADKSHRNNLLFYLLMTSVCIALRTSKPRDTKKIGKLKIDSIGDEIFQKSLDIVRPIYKKYGENDKAAKGTEMIDDLKEELKARYDVKRKAGK